MYDHMGTNLARGANSLGVLISPSGVAYGT